MSGAFPVRDEFDGSTLPPYWMMMRNPRARWYALEEGTLTLTPRPVGLGDLGNPSFLARRQQHSDASASTRLRFSPREGEKAGLAALHSDEYWYLLAVAHEAGRRVVRLERRAGPAEPAAGIVLASSPLNGPERAPVYLRIEARGDEYDFSYALREGEWRPLFSGADGRLLSTRTAGGFVGATFGLHAYSPEVK
jgi:alpha-N-arabinofuranosidase